MKNVKFYPNQAIYILLLIIISSTIIISSCNTNEQNLKVLIIQDEMPQIEVLAKFLRETGGINVTIVNQQAIPQNLSEFKALIAFIHGKLEETAEMAIIDYTKKGGRLICLHHSISSGKAKNKFYFDFLGIQLDNPESATKPVAPGGGYAWRDPVILTLVNLNPDHYITRHNVKWNEEIYYTSSDHPAIERKYPSISLEDSEIYLNHKFTDGREKVVLCGIKYYDDRNGQLFMQDRGAWIKNQGKGKIIYFIPGHKESDYENQNISQMILNSIIWTP